MARQKRPGPHQGRSQRSLLAALHKDTARLRRSRATAMAAPEAVADSVATFTCSVAGCVVGITCAGRSFAFVGVGSHTLPRGSHILAYRVAGPAKIEFKITASGATMAAIQDTTDGGGRAAGTADITV